MTPRQIRAMPVQPLCADDCMLFLWATGPLLPTALSVVDAWGFGFLGVSFTWVKTTSGGVPAWGMGHYTRSNAEFCLLGVKGKPRVESHSVHSVEWKAIARRRQLSGRSTRALRCSP